MDANNLKIFKSAMSTFFDESMKEKLGPYIGEVAAQTTKEIVEQLRVERAQFGQDRTGLSEKQKKISSEWLKAFS